MNKKDYKNFQKYSGQDWYLVDHCENPDLDIEILLEASKYEALNKLQPTVVHKPNGESYVRYYDGTIGDYSEYLKQKEIEDLERSKNCEKYFWDSGWLMS